MKSAITEAKDLDVEQDYYRPETGKDIKKPGLKTYKYMAVNESFRPPAQINLLLDIYKKMKDAATDETRKSNLEKRIKDIEAQYYKDTRGYSIEEPSQKKVTTKSLADGLSVKSWDEIHEITKATTTYQKEPQLLIEEGIYIEAGKGKLALADLDRLDETKKYLTRQGKSISSDIIKRIKDIYAAGGIYSQTWSVQRESVIV